MRSEADFQRLSLFLARRTGDPDYAQTLAMDSLRWASGQEQAGVDVPFGSLLAVSAGTAAAAIADRDKALAGQKSMAGIVAGLPREEREVLRLIYWDHLSMGELADFLNCTMARAGVLLHKAYRHAQRRAKRLGNDLESSPDEPY
ncbi:sigma factor-like helix-turn-helix DNA-binding protein [Paenarthrobacter sp.]|uniref:sigma factor-like helix-turn-helix DNA-binding protein n=1 Tax=Paenarthrobacter sp. TaxID=1931993 RepID=UPI002811DBD3|nr:sigma factor-like helix-turn-helix DNA-binding protein [Paenarthrobacter sp.]